MHTKRSIIAFWEMDKENWTLLAERADNRDIDTKDIVEDGVYRYVRLELLRPSRIDFQARIIEVEILGE